MTNEQPTRIVHHVAVGLGADGFRAICSCGWRMEASWERSTVARAGRAHEHQSRAKDLKRREERPSE